MPIVGATRIWTTAWFVDVEIEIRHIAVLYFWRDIRPRSFAQCLYVHPFLLLLQQIEYDGQGSIFKPSSGKIDDHNLAIPVTIALEFPISLLAFVV